MICDTVDTKNTYKKQGNIINRENKCQNGIDMLSGKKLLEIAKEPNQEI
jgi:hypothetical protein